MLEYGFGQPDFVGRKAELNEIDRALSRAKSGKGSSILIKGESGVGKTRLMSEIRKHAEHDFKIIHGWCMRQNLEPLMAIRNILRSAKMEHLLSDALPTVVFSAYLMDDVGTLITKAERDNVNIEQVIFDGILQRISTFVGDQQRQGIRQTRGALNHFTFEDYTVMILSAGNLSLATAIKGMLSEFLIKDMEKTLLDITNYFDGGTANAPALEYADQVIATFVESDRYDGKYDSDNPRLRQEVMFDNILLGLQRASSETPLLICLDDLQWANSTTLDFLDYLARNTRNNRILILGTCRLEDVSAGMNGGAHPLDIITRKMDSERLLENITLGCFDIECTKELIGSCLGDTGFAGEFYERVQTETEGSPFFILETLKLLAEEGAISPDRNGVWHLVKPLEILNLPSRIDGVIKRRLEMVNGEQRDILEWASVIGDVFSTDILTEASRMNKSLLLMSLIDIEKRHGLLQIHRGKYRFEHAKIREAIYSGIGEDMRREYHRSVGDAIAKIHQNGIDMAVNELAHHYYEAGDRKAGGILVIAGDIACDKYANEEAIEHYTKALEIIGDDSKSKILEKLADILVLMGKFDAAIQNFRKAGEFSAGGEFMARMLRKTGNAHFKKGEYDLAIEYLTEAKQHVDKSTAEYGRILFAQGYPCMKKCQNENAMGLFREAIEIAERVSDDRKDMGNALRAVGIIHWNMGEYDLAMDCYGRSLEVMESIGERHGVAAALGNMGNVHNARGDFDKALDCYLRSLEIFEAIGGKSFIANLLGNVGSVHILRGDTEKARDYYERSLEIKERIGDRLGIAISLCNLANLYGDMGETERAFECYERSMKIHESMEDRQGMAYTLNNIGFLRLEMTLHDGVMDYFERSLAISREIGDRQEAAHTLCGIAEAMLETGDTQGACDHAAKALEIAVELGALKEEGMSRRVLGMASREMGDWMKAREYFDTAGKILHDVGERKEMARLSQEYSVLHKAMGDKAAARNCIEEALSEFNSMGMCLLAERCRNACEDMDDVEKGKGVARARKTGTKTRR